MNQAATHLSQYLDSDNQTIEAFDTELWSAMSAETVRQEEHIELIASENYCSPRVLEAQGHFNVRPNNTSLTHPLCRLKCSPCSCAPYPHDSSLTTSECV